ncbi:MAG: pyridoxine 5'-phosphate synthase [Candidatus Omnitrophica bacterium]|nr:pyridoxine 5'-phosphate synthase [Candidatus Omnitrophota bacterium]MBU4472573.1 pyridoxine 5'-phosphate synthase [Candidatus Omnitrophota bacterium]MCG2705959.1 pyridoxine 5'-phosphate synthase [Candidatus Omnitrophota bacterium]
MPQLGVNIDHIATLREVRGGLEPEPVFAALVCESAGADSIVVHLREDRRHIKERDLCILKEVVKTKLNLEMAVAQDIVKIACAVKPEQATLVPERRQELTTEGGLDVVSNFKRIRQVLKRLEDQGINVSLFIDPDRRQIEAAGKIGVSMIELHTGRYAGAANAKKQDTYFKELETAVDFARDRNLHVFAGHGLDYSNVSRVAKIKAIEELNIGYSIVCRAALVGLEQAVRQMRALING